MQNTDNINVSMKQFHAKPLSFNLKNQRGALKISSERINFKNLHHSF